MTNIKIIFVTCILTALYILTSVSLTNLVFKEQSNGSLIIEKNIIIGSRLIGQEINSNKYFQGRPSQNKYKNDLSGNSNYGYHSEKLKETINNNYKTYIKKNNSTPTSLNDISESASGLDPHILISSAYNQINKISNNSELSKEQIIKIIEKHSKPRIGGLFGDKIVNVLEANIELKRIYDQKTRTR